MRTIWIGCAAGSTADPCQRLAPFEDLDKERTGPPGSNAGVSAAA